MKLTTYLTLPMACLLLSGVAYAQPVTVDDSGFESPAVTGVLGLGAIKNYTSNTSSPLTYINGSSGWYVSGSTPGQGSVTLVNSGLLGSVASPLTGDSGQYMVLNGSAVNLLSLKVEPVLNGGGGVSQVINTVPGQAYSVSYMTGGLTLGVVTPNTAQLYAGVEGITVSSPSGGALVNLGLGSFTNESFNFTATGTQSTLDFYENGALAANVGGIALDNVSVTAVPEPKETAAMILGFILALMGVRKLKQKFINQTENPVAA